MTKDDIIINIDNVLDRLSRPLPKEELEQGWSESSKEAIKQILLNLRSDLISNTDKKMIAKHVEYYTMSRGLDWSGIQHGELLDDVSHISALTSKYIKTD